MSRRVLSVLSIGLAFALLLALGWRAFAPAEPGAPPARSTVDGDAAASAVPGDAAPGIADPAADAVRSNASPPPEPQRLLRIVGESNAPVANADVAFDLSAELLESWGPLTFDVEERLAAAARYRTSPDGIVTLPTDAAVAFVIARAGERFGHGKIEFDSRLYGVPELTIAPDRTLRIAVVGPHGEPRPNVPVEVAFQSEQALVGEGTSTRGLPRTDGDGVTTLWHAQTLSFWNRAEAAVDVGAIVLGATPPKRRVSLADPVSERIVLECPDHGGIRVRAWVGPGVRNGDPLQPYVGSDGVGFRPRPWLVLPGASPTESCVFPVALGRTWDVGANRVVVTADRRWLAVAGPVRHGDEVVVDLPQHVTGLCTAMLLQPDGRPCALHRIEIDREDQSWAETDAQGRLTVPVWGQEISFHSPQLHAHACVAVPPNENAVGPTDLGTVRLQPMALLAAGRTVDAATGRPVHADVLALRLRAEQYQETLARADPGADGAFELWGEAIDRFRLRAAMLGYTTADIEMASGARDLVVALQPSRLLRATVLVDPAVAIEDFSVRVHHGDDSTGWRTARIEDGRFHALFELPAGDDLVLVVSGSDELPSLRRVPATQWTQANGVFETTVDLRSELANVCVTVRQPDREAAPEGSLYVRPTGSSAPWASFDLARRIVFAVPNGTTLDAIARPDAGVCIRTTLHPGENPIDVPPPSVVQIEVAGLPQGVARTAIGVRIFRLTRREPLLDELVAAGVDVDPGEGLPPQPSLADLERQETEHGWQVFGEGPARFELPRRGSYLAVPYVVANDRRVPLLYSEIVIEITTPGAVVEKTIRLDPEKVRAALK